MAIYTYEVDHGDGAPAINAGMELNGGKVTAVQFDAGLSRLEKLEDAARTFIEWYGKNLEGFPVTPELEELKTALNIVES